MRPAFLRRGLSVIVLATVLVGCASNSARMEAEAEAARVAAEAAAARLPPPIALSTSVAEAASVYLTFTRDIQTMEGGFENAEAIQAALRRGAAYDPAQLSRGLVAYASIVALQSPEFVAGVRRYAVDRTVREELAANIISDPRWASTLPGSDAAAGLVMQVLREDIDALSRSADSIENDAYTIQSAWEPRRAWAIAHIRDREGRLQDAKTRSTAAMLPSGPEAARLLAAARDGQGLVPASDRRRAPPYPPVVERALALAALAALGEAGDNARTRTDALQNDPVSQNCLRESKLMLFQCLAASRPSYEDMFCLGRHIVRDLATCTRGAAQPPSRVLISDLETTDTPEPAIEVEPLVRTPAPPPARPEITAATPPAPVRSTPVQSSPAPSPPQQSPLSATERLNTTPGTRPN